MEYPGFVGETYPARSYAVSFDRIVNWYPEIVESHKGKSVINYYPMPGLILTADCSALGAGRAAFALDGRQWAVIGQHLIEFNQDGIVAQYPADDDPDPVLLKLDDNPATIVPNSKTPPELMISSGGNGYVFDTGTNKLSLITGGIIDPGGLNTPGTFLGASMFAFLEKYGIALTPDSRAIQISQMNDATAWSLQDTSSNTGSADKVKAIITDHEYLYMAGSKRMAVYTNSGNPDFPIVPVPGAFIEQGIRAPYSFQRIDNSLMWYGENEHGAGCVYRADGFIPKRVSTHPIEAIWCNYGEDADAIAFTQQRDGHTFYRLTFPAQDQTWVYDLTTDMWHERALWDSDVGQYHAQTQRFHCYATSGTFGRYFVVGADGKIYREDNNTYTEDGRTIRRVRIAPVLAKENKRIFVSRLEVVLQPGVGLDGDPLQPGTNPQVMLRYSWDSGKTWSAVLTASAGRSGDYEKCVVFDQLGSGRAFIPEISVTDPVNWVIISAQVEITVGKR